ncbi:MAG: hypothetical protein RMJ81_04960 [Candidatus Kryptonium sp.]|nr:hypothetical protein [Candidatus Kryptonium sp.]MDW8108990.1 hypothetical protein [Candidatus Kryptonium sp.]
MKRSLNLESGEITLEEIPNTDWSIILTNGKYTSLVLYNGTGHSFYEHPTFNSILKWAPKINSQLGRFIYIRDTLTEESWCINLPKVYEFSFWKVSFGIGYLKIKSLKNKIYCEITYFVPIDKDLEYWFVKIRNESGEKRNLKVFSAVELSLGDLRSSILEPYHQELFIKTWVNNQKLFATNNLWNKTVFFSSEPTPESFDCLKSAFIGNGTIELPQAVKEGWCFESIANGREAIFSFQHDIQIENADEKEILIALGVLNERTKSEAKIEIAKNDFEKMLSFYRDELFEKGVKVKTPDENINLFINRWNKYQNLIYFYLGGHSANSYTSGSDMVNYKDSVQSIIGILPINHNVCKERLKYLFRFQLSNGKTCDRFNPFNNFSTHSDDTYNPLWLCIATFEYLKETGNFKVLEENLNYYDSEENSSIYEHLKRGIDFVLGQSGNHQLILEKLSSESIESTLTSLILLYALNEWIKLNEFLEIDVEKYKVKRENIRNAINRHCYEEYKKLNNAGWFIRGFTKDGEKIGSYFSKEGKIYLEPQIWAVLSDVCDKDIKIKCLNSAIEFLESTYGFLLLDPAYTTPDDKLGITTRLIAGEKENASFSITANAWAVMAFSTLSDVFKGKSFEVYTKLLPLKFLNDKRYKAEPFLYPEYICGKDSPHFGEASFTWLTSSSVWMFKSFLEYICGIKPDYDGIYITQPSFPDEWDEIYVKRIYRNCVYEFKYSRTGEFYVKLDAQKLTDNKLPVCGCGKVHQVEIFF